jgi:Chaperone of endosialidase
MAYTNRNILITPNIGNSAQEPIIAFQGGSATSSATTYIRVLDTGAQAWEGLSGQLQSVIDSMAGNIYTVNDSSGIPSLIVQATGQVQIAPYQGVTYIGSYTAPTQSTTTGTGSLVVAGGLGISGNLNIGGSFALSANLAIGGSQSTYGLNVNTTTNVAAYLYNSTNLTGIALQVGASTYPMGIGINSYNNAGTTYVMGTGYNAQVQLNSGNLQFLVSSASQSSGAIATQLNGLTVSATGISVPQSTAITLASGVASTGTGAIVTLGGISAGGSIVTAGDAFHSGVRVGTGQSSISTNLVIGTAAGANLLTGGTNALIGYYAGNALTSSAGNTAIGYQALLSQTATGGNNVAIGYQAMYTANNSGLTNNVAIGYRALGTGNGSFYSNTAIGYQAGFQMVGGYQNTLIGYNAGNPLTNGFSNTLVGYNAGSSLSASAQNVVILGGASGGTAVNNGILISDGAGNIRLQSDGSGNWSMTAGTAANGTTGVGTLAITGGASISAGLTLGGALYIGGSAGTSGYALTSTGTGLQWAQTGITVSNITTNATYYPLFTNSVSGAVTNEYVDSSHLTYNPSSGTLSATTIIATSTFQGPIGSGVTAYSGNFTSISGSAQFAINATGYTHTITGQTSGALTVNNNSAGNGSGVCLAVNGSGDINITTGGSLFFGSYNYAGGSYIRGYSNGEIYMYRTGNNLFQTNGTGAMQVNGVLYVTGDLYTNTSDIRLKTVLAPVTGASAKLKTLDTFTYVNNELAISLGQKSTRVQVGLNAAQVQAVQPEATGLAPFDVDAEGNSKTGENYLTVQYEKLVPLVIAGHNEHSDEIAALKQQVAELKALVAKLLK